MPEERITIHDLLLRDWSTELPIRGGYGQSLEDPPDPENVALTQLSTGLAEVVAFLAQARSKQPERQSLQRQKFGAHLAIYVQMMPTFPTLQLPRQRGL